MIAQHHTLARTTHGNDHILDLAQELLAKVADSGGMTGQAALLVEGSTAALTTLEFEPGLAEHDIGTRNRALEPPGSSAVAPRWG